MQLRGSIAVERGWFSQKRTASLTQLFIPSGLVLVKKGVKEERGNLRLTLFDYD